MRRLVASEVASGITPDAPAYNLPDGLWSDSRNVRYRDGVAEKWQGDQAIFGSLSVTAMFVTSIADSAGTTFWVYAGANVQYATEGSAHANIGGPGTLSAADNLNYTGGAYHGFLILNDGNTVPQSWSPALINNLTSLSAWPSTMTAKVLRPFKDFLVALDITESGTRNPRLIRWSDAGQQGALPGSWDYTDPTNQAGITELGQTQDRLVDCGALRDSLVVYKETNIWLADYVGWPDVLGFRQAFSQIGLLNQNCFMDFGAQHLAVGDNDIVVHDGQQAQSVVDGKTRKWFFRRLSADHARRTFLVADRGNREILICFCESGNDWPNLALVWNWANGTWAPRELGRGTTFGASGFLPSDTAETFDASSGTFDSDVGTFDTVNANPTQRAVIMVAAGSPLAVQLNQGETFNGQPMTCYATREGAALSVQLLDRIKRVHAFLPRVIGTAGDTLRIYIGTRDAIDAATSWSGPYPFTIGVDYKIDARLSARIFDFRVEYTGANPWRLFGFEYQFDPDGYR